jgi:site-specific recombinase XerD
MLDDKLFLELIEAIPKRDSILLRLLFETGCSINDLCNFRPKDFLEPKSHTDLFKIKFDKPARKSVISYDLGIKLKLFINSKERKSTDFLFSQKPTKPLSAKRIEQIVQNIFRASNVQYKPIEIRYLHIKRAILSGLSIDSIAEQTGLKKQRILQIVEKLDVKCIQSYTQFFEMSSQTKINNFRAEK